MNRDYAEERQFIIKTLNLMLEEGVISRLARDPSGEVLLFGFEKRLKYYCHKNPEEGREFMKSYRDALFLGIHEIAPSTSFEDWKKDLYSSRG